MLRLIAFCTSLIRLLGTAFSTLRLARYKEFSKQVGQTIRLVCANKMHACTYKHATQSHKHTKVYEALNPSELFVPYITRNTVAFVSDHWSAYRAYRILRGDDLASLPTELQGSEYKHSLNRLQVEFDQYVLRSVKWILTAQK